MMIGAHAFLLTALWCSDAGSRLVYTGSELVQTGLLWSDAGPDWFILALNWSRLVYCGLVLVQTGYTGSVRV